MSENLTTEQIIRFVTGERLVPVSWPDWASAVLLAANDSSQDAVDGARFLEHLEPGRTWSAAEYHGLMYNHFTGRWESALHIAHIRLGEWREDMLENHADRPGEPEHVEMYYKNRMEDDALAVKWLRDRPGTYVFECADGTVLTFDGILDGVIDTGEPF